MEVNHKNGNTEDNRPGNLEIVTSSGNKQHAMRVLKSPHCVNQFGEKNCKCRLTWEDVQKIRSRYERGEDLMSITKDFPVQRAHISNIARGRKRVSA